MAPNGGNMQRQSISGMGPDIISPFCKRPMLTHLQGGGSKRRHCRQLFPSCDHSFPAHARGVASLLVLSHPNFSPVNEKHAIALCLLMLLSNFLHLPWKFISHGDHV